MNEGYATIQNIKGVESATIQIRNLTVLAGYNGVGKTTILQSIGLTLSDIKMTAPKAAEFLRYGAETGEVQVQIPTRAMAQWTLPKNEKQYFKGVPPKVTPYAAGLKNFSALEAKDRAAELQRLLENEPTKEDLLGAIYGREIPRADEPLPAPLQKEYNDALTLTNNVWAVILKKTWEGAAKEYEDQAKHFKSRFHEHTGMTWGSDQGPKWLPKDWEQNLSTTSEDTLTEVLSKEREILEQWLKSDAVDEAEMEKLRDKWFDLDDKRKAVAAIEEQIQLNVSNTATLLNTLQSAQAAVKNHKPLDKAETYKCAHCSKENILVEGVLMKPKTKPPTETEIKKHEERGKELHAAVIAAKNEHDAAVADYHTLSAQHAKAQFDVESGEAALKEYQEKLKHEGNKTAVAQIDEQRNKVAHAERRLKAFQLKQRADVLNASVIENLKVFEILRPTGLKHKLGRAAVQTFNEKYLAPLAKQAGYPRVEITSSNEVSYNNRVTQLSTGQKFRANTLVQLALARLEGSEIILIDAADVLDPAGRRGLFSLLETIEIPTIISMMLPKADAQTVASMGYHTYWLDGGKATLLQPEAVPA